MQLTALDTAQEIGDMEIPGFKLHNKELKCVPDLRPFTGRKNATHFYAA